MRQKPHLKRKSTATPASGQTLKRPVVKAVPFARPGAGKGGPLNEESLIKTLRARFAHKHPLLIKGIGDDTSVTASSPSTVLLATTDTLVESTHFTLKHSTAYQIGKKALNVSVSDIAAMGGRPAFFLVSLVLPGYIESDFVTGLYRGITAAAKRAGAVLAGGNMAAGANIAVTVTLFGESAPDRVVYRDGAKDGDGLYVTGTPGDSALGLKMLGRRGHKGATKEELLREYRGAVKRHLAPAPRLAAGIRLAEEGLASSMIDISDGLALDAKRLARESGADLLIDTAAVPLSADMKRYMAKSGRNAKGGLVMALSGGEDYELLFTSGSGNDGRIKRAAKELGLKITRIGTVTSLVASKEPGVRLLDGAGNEVALESGGYTHF